MMSSGQSVDKAKEPDHFDVRLLPDNLSMPTLLKIDSSRHSSYRHNLDRLQDTCTQLKHKTTRATLYQRSCKVYLLLHQCAEDLKGICQQKDLKGDDIYLLECAKSILKNYKVDLNNTITELQVLRKNYKDYEQDASFLISKIKTLEKLLPEVLDLTEEKFGLGSEASPWPEPINLPHQTTPNLMGPFEEIRHHHEKLRGINLYKLNEQDFTHIKEKHRKLESIIYDAKHVPIVFEEYRREEKSKNKEAETLRLERWNKVFQNVFEAYEKALSDYEAGAKKLRKDGLERDDVDKARRLKPVIGRAKDFWVGKINHELKVLSKK